MKTPVIALLMTVLALGMAVCSCSNTKYVSAQPEVEAAWVGKTYSDIVQVNGAPDRESSDGNDGIILIYENVRTYANTYGNNYGPGWYGPWYGGRSSSYSTEVRNEIDYIQFFIGTDKVCYKVKTNLMKPLKKENNQ